MVVVLGIGGAGGGGVVINTEYVCRLVLPGDVSFQGGIVCIACSKLLRKNISVGDSPAAVLLLSRCSKDCVAQQYFHKSFFRP